MNPAERIRHIDDIITHVSVEGAVLDESSTDLQIVVATKGTNIKVVKRVGGQSFAVDENKIVIIAAINRDITLLI